LLFHTVSLGGLDRRARRHRPVMARQLRGHHICCNENGSTRLR
jgi:hypothetical protein